MADPIAICIEDLDATNDALRYLQCTAINAASGLGIDARGQIHWRAGKGLLQLCVSGDEQLLLYLPRDVEVTATVRRAGRWLVLPPGRPVEVLDGDELDVGQRHLRIHVHGQLRAAREPRWVTPRPSQAGGLAAGAATVLAVGAALAAGGCDERSTTGEIPPSSSASPQRSAPRPDHHPPPPPDARVPDQHPPPPPDARVPDQRPAPTPDALIKRVTKTTKIKRRRTPRQKKIKVRVRPPMMEF